MGGNARLTTTATARDIMPAHTTKKGYGTMTQQRYATELHRLQTIGRYTANAYGEWLPKVRAEYLRILHLWNRDNYRQLIEEGK